MQQVESCLQQARDRLIRSGKGRVIQYGRSVVGRPLEAWYWQAGRQRIHLNAAIHANEWITTLVLSKWIAWMAQSQPFPHSLIVVPIVNPDGVQKVFEERCPEWKANARGVDLNDQFPAGWHTERLRRQWMAPKPGPRDYGGEHPLSEPESRALVRLTRRVRPDVVVALHTQGREIYYNYRGLEPAYSRSWAQHLSRAPIQRPYRAVALLDSDAGFKDWFIAETGLPGFTIEMGNGINPLPILNLNELFEDFQLMMGTLAELVTSSMEPDTNVAT